MSWNSFVTDYLSFSKKDRMALFFILLVIAGCYIVPFFLNAKGGAVITEDSLLIQSAEGLSQRPPPGDSGESRDFFTEYGPARDFKQGERFAFDPNRLDAEGWARLGLPPKVIRTISNYRNKGGRFHRKEDLQKIWGLPAGFYKRVEPFIRIERQEKQQSIQQSRKENFRTAMPVRSIDINTADTSAWIALPGIGNTLALRILRFRERLGGFYSANQVAETYGLPDSTFQQLRPLLQVNPDQIKKININTATKEDLKTHPYIRWNLANAIVEYRNQHGPYKEVSGLRNIALVDEPLFNKLRPYLVLE